MRSATALVLAGKRDGALDPLAAEAGVSHKCQVPVAGRPMIVHVLAALAAAEIGRILVSIDDPAALPDDPMVRALAADGRLKIVAARPALLDSVVAAAEGAAFPLLITTADNVLLTPEGLAELHRRLPSGADAAVAFARREAVLAAHPDGQRRFYRFADGEYSNCNLYWLASPGALKAAGIFRQGGQFAKHPARIAAAFGVVNLVRFRLGWWSLARMMQRLSLRFGLRLAAVSLRDGALAIDVDNARTKGVAEMILASRAAASPLTAPDIFSGIDCQISDEYLY